MKKRISALVLASLMLLALAAGCAKPDAGGQPPESAAPDAAQETPAASAESEKNGEEGSEGSDKVAKAEDMTTVEEVVEEGMTPVYADSLVDGVYPVEMKSSSSMFKADHCELSVENGKMQVLLYMTSKAYTRMFAGTAEQAASAAEDVR